MNSRQNIFLNSPEKPAVWLNQMNDLSRKMYENSDKNDETLSGTIERDSLINVGIREKSDNKVKDSLIRDMSQEIRKLKAQVLSVLDKDKEIYRLECENTLLRKENSEYKESIVTDETLRTENETLQMRIEEYSSLEKKYAKVSEKLIELYHENQRLQKGGFVEMTDEQFGSFIRSHIKYNTTV
jgi:hypothetical protein